jgi:hypothetical protein
MPTVKDIANYITWIQIGYLNSGWTLEALSDSMIHWGSTTQRPARRAVIVFTVLRPAGVTSEVVRVRLQQSKAFAYHMRYGRVQAIICVTYHLQILSLFL